MRATAKLFSAGLWLATGLGGASALAQPSHPDLLSEPPAVLDVPYLPQSILLCGGAALAMVERWWGKRGVYPEDFASLVKPELGGILASDLAAAARGRSWDTRLIPGSAELVKQYLAEAVPVLAQIQVARNRFHFVVVLSWSGGRVVYHDPARSPFVSVDESRFLARWTGADRWAMVIRPAAPAPAVVAVALPDSIAVNATPCAPWIDHAMDAAALRQLEDASRLLDAASRACPGEPLVLRELAAVRFKQGRYTEAIALAAEYLERVPGDRLAWQMLASSRYLVGDEAGALDAWNRVGSPVVDLLRIDGARNTRFRGIADAVSVPHGTVLTPSRLALARRRVTEVPALRAAAIEYQPVPGGIVELRVAVSERPRMDRAWLLLASGVIRGLAQREVGFQVANPAGAGELWSAEWRWQRARARTAARLDLPVKFGWPGIVTVQAAREAFRFDFGGSGAGVLEEDRRAATFGFGGWVAEFVRPAVAARVEHWSGNRRFIVLSAGAELRVLRDRLAISAAGGQAVARSAHPAYTEARIEMLWTSGHGLSRPAWSSRIGVNWVSRAAPAGLWPVAGSDLSWAIPLRAHSATDGGTLRGRNTGRAILHGGLSGDHPVARVGPLVVAVGAFLDGAGILGAAEPSLGDRVYLDGGAGLRIGVPGGSLGVLRIDVAHGFLAGGGVMLTAGVHQRWPFAASR